MVHKNAVKIFVFAIAAFGATLLACGQVVAQQPAPAERQMQQMLQMYKPELREKVMALSVETRMHLMELMEEENRKSDKATLRQVMHEILSDFQSIVAGIATDNGEMVADAARRLASHRLPRGGLFPYLGIENITDDNLSALPAMEEAVEGTAVKLAEAAERGDMAEAAGRLSEIMTGCVACHQLFRGRPGISSLLIEKKGDGGIIK